MTFRTALLVPLAWLAAQGPAAAQTPLNLGFEAKGADPSTPEGWFVGGQGYEARLVGDDVREGKAALRLTRKDGAGGFGVATATLPVALARGKTVRFGGWVKTEDVTTGGARLWLRVDGPEGKTLAFDNMTVRIGADGKTVSDDRGVRGSTPWRQVAIEVAVPAEAVNVNFGVLLDGDGAARFDGLTLDFDGKPYDQARAEGLAALEPKAAQLDWLKANAVAFATDRAGSGFDDLAPLKAAVGDARVVALGEATHGTAEFFRMKHRLTEFLASEMGFTVFAIEASMPEAFRVNDYVLRGKGDPKALLSGMYFWTWNTQEVLDLILWMRAFNASGKGRVEFLGFDMQEPKVAAENVRGFVAKADPGYAPALDAAYAGLADYRGLAARRDRDEVDALARSVAGVVTRLEAERDRLAKADGVDGPAADWAVQNARIVSQAVNVLTGPADYRDRCMADNVDWILAQRPPGTKIVLWAHNGHVARRPGAMGGFLSERHKADLLVAGFAFHEGRYTAVAPGRGLRANDAAPSSPGSVEWAFHQAGLARAVLDLRRAEKGSPGSGWLAEPLEHRNVGALAVGSAFYAQTLPDAYDLLVFFDRTNPSVTLPFVGRD